MKRWLKRALIAVPALLVVGLLGLLWVGSSLMLVPPWYVHRTPEEGLQPRTDEFAEESWQGIHRDPQRDFGYRFEEVEFAGPEGATLRGWIIPGAPDARVGVVTVHGGGADRRDFLRHLPVFHEAGYPVLQFDCREHGISDGASIGVSYGAREHVDVSSAVAFFRERMGLERVAVVGTSQGGASVIMAAAKDPGIDAVVSENPFTTVRELLQHAVTAIPDGPQPGALLDVVLGVVEWRLGLDDSEWPIGVVGRIAPRPLLLMHGTDDRVIPYEQSERIHAAAPGSELWIAADAKHAALFNKYPEQWRERVLGFLAETVGAP